MLLLGLDEGIILYVFVKTCQDRFWLRRILVGKQPTVAYRSVTTPGKVLVWLMDSMLGFWRG